MSAIKSIPCLKFQWLQPIWTHKIIISCCALLFVLAISSCDSFLMHVTPTPQATREASLMDRSIFNDTPCKAPCWYGLKLGESTEADVLAVLQTLSFVDPSTIQEDEIGYWDSSRREDIRATLIAAGCKEPAGRQCVGLIIANDTLVDIGLFPNYNLTFQEVVNHLGLPDYVRVGLVPPAHDPGCSIKLIWMDRQIIVDHTDRSSIKLCGEIRSGKGIDPTLIAQSIAYVLPEDALLETIPAPGSDYPWPGFIKP